MPSYYLAWWNLENLFDEEDASRLGRRTEKLARVLRTDLEGWTAAVRDQKIGQLASVVAGMNGGAGPDLLGVCEVENRFVVDRLVDAVNARLARPRAYDVIHADTEDERGIDVAFVYDSDLLAVPEPRKEAVFYHVVMRRNATREIVQVTFRTRTEPPQTFVVFGNHWPSRSAGQYESAGYRAVAGETLGYWHERVLEVLGEDTPVIACGDMNDEPFDASLVTHALSTRQRAKVTAARGKPLLWNLMWPTLGRPDGTFYYDNQPNVLDQFLVNKNLASRTARLVADPSSVCIVKPDGSLPLGDSVRPRPFGLGPDVDKDGYSDHFPIAMTLTLAR